MLEEYIHNTIPSIALQPPFSVAVSFKQRQLTLCCSHRVCRHTALLLLQTPESRLYCCRVTGSSTQIDLFLGFVSSGLFTISLEKALQLCLTVSGVFKLGLSPCMACEHQKGAFVKDCFEWTEGSVFLL